MATPITGIVADLQLQSAAFIRDLNKASAAVAANTSKMQRSLGTLEKGFANAAGFAKGFLGAAISIQGLRALTELGNRAIQTGDEISETATKLGVGAEALQRFRFAAAQADVDAAALDATLRVFQKNVASGKIPTQTFDEIIEKIAAADTQLEKVAIAAPAFGKQYQSALLIAAQGADSFKKSMDSAFIISSKAVQVASDLDNQLRAIGNAAQTGFQTGFLEGFAGALDSSNDHLVDINRSMKTLGEAIGNIAKTTASLIDKASRFLAAHPDLLRLAFDPTLGGAPTPGGIAGAGRGVGQFRFPQPLPTQGHPPGGLRSVAIPTESIDENTEAIVNNQKALEDWATTTVDALGRSLEFNDLQSEGVDVFKNSQTAIEEYGTSIERLKVLLAAGAIDAETFGRAHQQLALGMAQNWLGAAGAVTGALASIFKENKAFAIADAVINTAAAIVSALKNPPGPPFSFVYAAAAAAAGAAQIATILSTDMGSGAKTPSLKTSKGASAAGAASTAATSEKRVRGGPTQSVQFIIQGDVFGPEHFRKIVAGLNSVSDDGTQIRIGSS